MKTLILDVESTTIRKGHPFHKDNKLCLVGLYELEQDKVHIFDIEYSNGPYRQQLVDIKNLIENCDVLVGFNLKFDLHWIRRYINDIHFPDTCFDCQLGEFIISNQRKTYPSLNESCDRFHLDHKLSVVDSEYWANGIDTPNIPRDILWPYLERDLQITGQLYKHQSEVLKDNKLIGLHNKDLLVLQEMEFNGMLFDEKGSESAAIGCEEIIEGIENKLTDDPRLFGYAGIDWNSSYHLSVVLFGGTLSIPSVIPTERLLKDGTIKHGTKHGYRYLTLPKLCNPEDRTEVKNTKKYTDFEIISINAERVKKADKVITRIYSVDDDNLNKIKYKNNKAQHNLAYDIIVLLQRHSECNKLLTTYFRGLPKAIKNNGWESNMLHGQFNQCVVRTGRLSSSDPNLQNIVGEAKHLFYTRYI